MAPAPDALALRSAGPAERPAAPLVIEGPRRVPIPSAQFVGRYMQRLEERATAGKPEADVPLKEEEVEKDKDVEKGGRAQQIKALLDVNKWTLVQIIKAVATKNHKALKFLDPQPGGGRRLTQWIMWAMYCYTGLTLVAYYDKSTGCMPCNKPVEPEGVCEGSGSGNLTDAVGRRLLRIPDGRVLLPTYELDGPESLEQASERLDYTIATLRMMDYSHEERPWRPGYLAILNEEADQQRLQSNVRHLSAKRETVEDDGKTIEDKIAEKIEQCKIEAAAALDAEWNMYYMCIEQYQIKFPMSGKEAGAWYKLCAEQIIVMFLSSVVAAPWSSSTSLRSRRPRSAPRSPSPRSSASSSSGSRRSCSRWASRSSGSQAASSTSSPTPCRSPTRTTRRPSSTRRR